jgi:hypothetical protein
MLRALASFVVCAGVSVACSSGSGTSTTGPSGGGTFSGTLGGETFTFTSGYGHVNADGSLDLILSDVAGVCETFGVAKKAHAGETLVQAYALTGTAPGVFAASVEQTIKYASVDPSCPSGQGVEGRTNKTGRATQSEISISKLTATEVEGKLTLSFDDGSSLSGTFTVPTCASAASKSVTCY